MINTASIAALRARSSPSSGARRAKGGVLAFTYHLAASAALTASGRTRSCRHDPHPSTEFLFTEPDGPARSSRGPTRSAASSARGRAKVALFLASDDTSFVNSRIPSTAVRRSCRSSLASVGHQLDKVSVRVGDERDALPGLGRRTRRPHARPPASTARANAASRSTTVNAAWPIRRRNAAIGPSHSSAAGTSSANSSTPAPLPSTTNAISTPSGTRAVVVCSRSRTSRYQATARSRSVTGSPADGASFRARRPSFRASSADLK